MSREGLGSRHTGAVLLYLNTDLSAKFVVQFIARTERFRYALNAIKSWEGFGSPGHGGFSVGGGLADTGETPETADRRECLACSTPLLSTHQSFVPPRGFPKGHSLLDV